eukprot:m.352505 g.352505  ORF g.352505 m.352505 type:complete len:302 (-) comp16537_c0_seq1:127-1032(-)
MDVVLVKTEDAVVEVPLEADGTISQATLESQFPGATGLRYPVESGRVRAVRVVDGKLNPPLEDGTWGTLEYTPVIAPSAASAKRRTADAPTHDDADDNGETSSKRAPATHDRQERSCYQCGGTGHIANMCPSPPGAKERPEGRECHQCNGKGHIKSQCPNSIPANVCYRCRMYGHQARDCPSLRSSAPAYDPYRQDPYQQDPYRQDPYRQDPYGSSDPYYQPPRHEARTCHICKQPGHLAAQCSQPRVCHQCKQPGHIAAECSQPRTCHVCGEPGHISRDCSKCKICKMDGHRSYDCPQRF